MTRLSIDCLVIEGLPHLDAGEVRKHLVAYLSQTFAGRHRIAQEPARPGPLKQTATARGFAAELAAALKEVLVVR